MRALLAGCVSSVMVGAMFAAPPVMAQDVGAATVTPVANPFIKETCGLDAALILDASGSIQSAGAVNTVRNAGRDLTAALKDTNSTLRITQFATFSGQLSSRVPVNAATTGAGGALSTALTNYYTPPPPRPAGVTIYNGNQMQNSALTWTNWEDGIKGIDTPELAIYITDGDPTAYNASATRTNVNTPSTGVALDNAITQANALKTAGTRMLVVGVGNGLTSSSSQDRLKKISGPLLEKSAAALAGKTINQVDAVAFTDFAALGAFLRSVVTSLCGNSVTVQKLAQSSAGADYLPAPGWDITVEPTVTGGYTWVDPTGPEGPKTRAT
ncbi:MAG: VWA domain-containing protein, partial [Candidatus Nanopelagicales bacterium]|nr:VWA domain-containing protein [Candidatus Nanopelagicales bacterium]